jgi:hypothetical protein
MHTPGQRGRVMWTVACVVAGRAAAERKSNKDESLRNRTTDESQQPTTRSTLKFVGGRTTLATVCAVNCCCIGFILRSPEQLQSFIISLFTEFGVGLYRDYSCSTSRNGIGTGQTCSVHRFSSAFVIVPSLLLCSRSSLSRVALPPTSNRRRSSSPCNRRFELLSPPTSLVPSPLGDTPTNTYTHDHCS